MKIVEIFDSIEGEGKRAGELATFIRTAGCNLRCSYCDTPYAQSICAPSKEMSIDEIIARVNYNNVTITGGEPLIQEDIKALISQLCEKGFYVNIETNGSVILEKFRKVRYKRSICNNPFFTMDYKCYSSGMNKEMKNENLADLTPKDVIKFVVQDETDLAQAYELKKVRAIKYLSPVFGEIEPKRIVNFMKKFDMIDFKIQLQLHKYIWNPEMKGV